MKCLSFVQLFEAVDEKFLSYQNLIFAGQNPKIGMKCFSEQIVPQCAGLRNKNRM
jgi:hypothetical protein